MTFKSPLYRRGAFLALISVCVMGVTPGSASDVRLNHGGSGWELDVDGKLYVVKGVAYSPGKVGEDPALGTQRDWMVMDDDHDGRIDAPYQAWVDVKRNNTREAGEAEVGDFKLMKDMGVNTIRIYHMPTDNPEIVRLYQEQPGTLLHYGHAPNKALLRDLYKTYGIRAAIGNFVGAYTIGSGATWEQGTDYRDPVQRENLMKSVVDTVKQFKDEPFVLLWILGNENNYPWTRTNAGAYPQAYAEFINEAAAAIHRLDGKHPVALCNGEVQNLRIFAKYAPNVDIFGVNSYRTDFGPLLRDVAHEIGKPVLFTEFGVYRPRVVQGELDEDYQASVHHQAWCSIENHLAGKQDPANAIGGFVFEWVDQWWYIAPADVHNISADNPEWHGLTSQGDGQHSPYLRQLRKAYREYQALWTGDHSGCQGSEGQGTP